MPNATKIDTAFTTRLTMTMMTDVVIMLDSAKRLALMVETQAKEHGIALPAEFVEAVAFPRSEMSKDQTDEKYIDMVAHIQAIEMVVRGLFAKWAEEAPDPQESAFRMIEGMIGSLHAVSANAPPEQVQVIGMIENHLREFGRNIEVRLSNAPPH